MAYRIELNEEECIGCGACEAQCPDNWEMDTEKMKAKPKKRVVKEIGCNKDAAEVCPVDVIKIIKK